MRSILRTFIKYPILGNSILVAIFMFGLVSFLNMKTTFFPEIESNTILIQAAYPGASPEEIEEGIVLKIEDNLKGVTGVDRVSSTSSENFARITVELFSGADINVVLQDVKNAVSQITSFPGEIEDLVVYKQEMMEFGISFVVSGQVDLRTLKETARDIERDLLAVDGISKITLSGFPQEEIEVAFREEDLRRYGLTFDQVANAVRSANVKMTGGKIKGTTEEFLIRADSKGYYADDLADHVLKATSDGTIIRLKDVADLNDRWSEDPNRVYFNGLPAVMVRVNSTNDEDLFFTADYVRNYIEEYNSEDRSIFLSVIRDGSEIVEARANILMSNGFLGVLLVLLFLSMSLNTRLSFWVALAIPISFAGMFMLGGMYGMTINVMSLMAMILVIGILVDDGIVIAENIYQHHERGEKPIKAAVQGTIEVLPAVSASIITTVVIFLTFFFLEGTLGDRAGDIAFVVIATLIFSLVEGMFILPAHVAHSKAMRMNANGKNRLELASARVLEWVRSRVYEPTLKFCIQNPLVAMAVPTALFVITIGAVYGSVIKMTFFPALEFDFVSVRLEMPAGTPDRITDSLLVNMEKSVLLVDRAYREQFDGDSLVTVITRSVGPNTNEGSLSITLTDSEHRVWSNMEVANHIRGQVGEIPGADNLEVGDRGGRFGKPVAVVLRSDDLDELREAKEVLKAELKSVPKLKDVVDDDPPGLREVTVSLREKAYSLGLTTAQVMSQVRSGFFGGEAQRIIRGTDEVKIYVRYGEKDRTDLGKLEESRIRLADGREFPLGEIADFSIERGVMSINHIDALRIVTVEASITDPNESVTDILADIRRDIMPGIMARFPDVDFDFEGQSRESAKTTGAMLQVVPAVLILMFLIIVVTFRSFLQAFIVFALIPLSLIGVAWGHFLQGYIISILSLFGTIALVGIVINDSLVFVSAFNRLLKQGMDFRSALFETGRSRFRPVILTSLTTIAGLGPLMLETSFHAQFLSPMAISVAYGLLFGTVMTLLILPVLLALVNRFKVTAIQLFTGTRPTPESVEPAIREERFANAE